MKVTVTGASGFVGGAVCRELAAAGCTVRGVVRRRLPEQPPPWETIRGDLCERETAETAVRSADVVVHAAGLAHLRLHEQVERDFHTQNVEVTERVARAAAGCGARLIYISSAAAAWAHTPYGRSKRRAEQRLRELGQSDGLRWIVVRPALLFGEHDPGNFLRLVVAVSRGRYLHIGGGRARKSLSYVGNVGTAMIALARSGRAVGRIYDLADPQPRTVREIITVIAECLGVTAPRLSLAAPIARTLGAVGSVARSAGLRVPLHLDMVETLLRDAVVDARPLEEEMGAPFPISFGQGVRRTVDWCRHAHIIS